MSILAIAIVLYDRITRWMKRKPMLYHEKYSNRKLRRYKQARFLVWSGDGVLSDDDEDASEGDLPAFMFNLVNRSSESVEIYGFGIGHLSTDAILPDLLLSSAVTVPFILKPYDNQRLGLRVEGEMARSSLLDTWNSRKYLWLAPGFNWYVTDIEVRTSQGVVRASVRGFSKTDISRRWLNRKLVNWRWKIIKSSSLEPLGFLNKEDWWE